MAPAPTLMTVDDYFAKTPETVTPAELVYGHLRIADSPTPRHQSAVMRLFLALNAHVSERKLGQMWIAPLDVILDCARALVVQPDLFFVSNERAFIVRDRIDGAPDLVIEVLSPHPRIGETDERVDWFMRHAVRECWLVQQDRRSIVVIEFEDRRVASRKVFERSETICSAVLPDFTASLDDILD